MTERNPPEHVGPAGPNASPPPDQSECGEIVEWLAGHSGMSRRGFIKGVIASGVAVSGVPFLANASPRPSMQSGGAERLISLNVNEQTRRVDVLPNETLAMTLRYKLGLTGTKLGCDRAECGACTVLIDGETHYSCSTLTHRVRARAITTVEGLESPTGQLHPVQQAFMDELAPQCGFCTPGQIMAAVGLLNANPDPTREEARRAMAGNICRCGAYDHYLNGVMRAAQKVSNGADR
jgi:aerobic-type carbon monoxide dehydrogenase small subunit (CoxS/CutS family)